MKSPRCLLFSPLLGVALVLTAALSPAFGIDDITGAKKKYKEGFSLFEEGQYPAALAAFEESYQRHPNPEVLFNIAMCQKAVFLYVEAIASLTQYLTIKGEALDLNRKKEIISNIESLEALVAKLRIEEAPENAEVRVDGKPIARIPMTGELSLNPGAHVVEVALQGYETFEKQIKASSGATLTVQASLKPAATRLRVDCWASESVVSIDNREVGRCPFDGAVTAGLHHVRVEAPNRKPFETDIDAFPGGTATVAVPQGTMPLLSDERDERPSEKTPVILSLPATPARRVTAMQVTGWVLIGTGVASAITGAVFTYKYVSDWNRAEAALDRYNQAAAGEQDPDDKETYNNTKDEIPGDRAGIIIGYTGAGVLTAAGIVLAVIGARRGRDNAQSTVVVPAPGGMGISF
jgi:tetratricopeptide (TPR) repeat protein